VTGTTYGVGNGSTTFNLPDLRGEFIRGWDDGRGVDTTGGARAFGTYQKGTIVAFNTPYNEGFTETLTASLDSNPNNGRIAVGADPANIADYPNTGKAFTSTGVSSTVAPFDWINTDQYGGGISRPRNVALLACIKF
jgi:microcystin-dependent protein